MHLQPATRSSKQPLGGISGGWRRRLLRFHLPLALASALVLVLFVTLPRFDASAYLPGDIFSGTFPRDYGEGGGPMDHEGDQDGRMETEHGGDQDGTMNTEHGGDQRGPMDHQGDETEGMGGDS